MTPLTPAQAIVLRAVHRYGSTAEAARRLNMAQSTVSKIVARGEATLGVTLFARLDGRLVPRPEVRALVESLGDVEAEWRSLQQTVTDLRSGRAMPLRIASTPSIGHSVIARALGRLLNDLPDARIDLKMGDPPKELSQGSAEIGLMFSPRVSEDITLTPLVHGLIVAVVRSDDPLAARDAVTLHDLVGRRLICFDREKSPLGWLIARAHDQAGLDYTPFLTVPYSISAASLVAHEGDVAVADSLLALPAGGMRKLRIEPAIPITACIMTVRSRPLSRLASRLLGIVKELEPLQ